ncbi:MAG: hypothetical protein ACM3QS_07190 [Bacteroidota bacterium]
MGSERIHALWRWFFLTAALEAGAAVLDLARVPSEGLSLARMVLFGVLGACMILALTFAFRPPSRLDLLPRPGFIRTAGLLALVIGVSLFLLRYLDPLHLLPLYRRLSPLLIYFLLLSFQAFFLLLVLHSGFHRSVLSAARPVWIAALVFFAALLLVALFIRVTRLGLTPDPAYWGEPGVPIQGWQFALCLLGGFAIFIYESRPGPRTSRWPALLIPLIIYVLAVAIWLSVPLEVLRNSFYAPIDPPYYDPFPYSDAGYYDTMAQSLLMGHPYQGEIPTRPLYIVLLAALHLLFGQRYDLIIAGQTFLLALIPVTLYLLGAKIHSRAAGVTAALLFISREWTTLLISSETRVSNTKTLLVDLPTLLLVLLGCLSALRWLERRDARSALLAGGTFGLLLLLRTQSLLLLGVILVFAALVIGLNKRFFLLSSFFLIGFAIAIVPWLLHNYLQTGQLSLDAAFQYKLMATQYAYTGNLDIRSFDFEGRGLGQILLQFLRRDPGFVFGFISNHFLAGWVGGLLALPLFQTYNGLFEPVNLYWMSWKGHLAWYNTALVVLYLAVISVGLAAAWRRWRWIGLLPLGFNVGYSLATALGRFSGWRYDLPADWVPYFYFAVGFAELLGILGLLFGQQAPFRPEPSAGGPASPSRPGQLALLALVFACLGGLPWIAALPAAPRYSDLSAAALTARLARVPGTPALSEVAPFLARPHAILTEGRLLYPRYFYRGTGMSSAHPWPAYAVQDYPRQGFLLLNGKLTDAIFPTLYPLDFPQGADALVLGCQQSDHIEVREIAFPQLNTAYLAAPLEEPCE